MNNDYDSILKRLKDAMPSDISVIEGSFCGDILCAVANELANLFDRPGDGLSEGLRPYGRGRVA